MKTYKNLGFVFLAAVLFALGALAVLTAAPANASGPTPSDKLLCLSLVDSGKHADLFVDVDGCLTWAGYDMTGGATNTATATPEPTNGAAGTTATSAASGAVNTTPFPTATVEFSAPSQDMGAGKPWSVTMKKGYVHFNVACGCDEGIENNYLVKYDGPDGIVVTISEGSVWWYDQLFAGHEGALWKRALNGSAGDAWPTDMPSFLSGVSGVTLMTPPSQ